jgi:Protein of unknown function (DUF3775)
MPSSASRAARVAECLRSGIDGASGAARTHPADRADEQIDLVALTWLGRGDGDIENWDELRAEAARAHNKGTAAYYLLGMPMLADHLEEALSKFGHSSEEVEPDLF